MKPCDCKDMLTAQTQLSEQGLAFNGNGILVEPNVVWITEGPAKLRIPMSIFRRYAEWYLADQKQPKKD